jgi:hypothetical protein
MHLLSSSVLKSHHLESCTPGQDLAKWYKLVCTSTYRYNMVQVTEYEISTLVQDSMYQYILVHAFNKTCGFPTHP